ncbi:hypothetical protein GC176_08720 [bacterium]|nr:hypothetical protein [bacterium]
MYRGTVRTDGRGNRVVTPLEVKRAVEQAQRAKQQADRQLKVLAEQSAALADQSFDSFSRGLMPLPDHLEQLKLTQRSELLTASDEKQAVEVQQRYVERMEAIVDALEEFNAPNAEGWQADLLLARALTAEARSDLATQQKRDGIAQAAREQALELAEDHLEQRQADSTIGWATVPMLVNAQLVVQRIQENEPYTLLPTDEFLDDAVTLTRSWQERDAGVGRADRLALAEYEQARFALRHGLELDPAQIAVLYQTAEAAAMDLYDQQREFLRSGTASLFDVALAWDYRSQLSDILSTAKLAPPETSERQLLLDLDALNELADDVTDRQGRIEADLSYIDVLSSRQKSLQALNDLDTANAAVEELKKHATEAEQSVAPPAPGDATRPSPAATDPPLTAPRKLQRGERLPQSGKRLPQRGERLSVRPKR